MSAATLRLEVADLRRHLAREVRGLVAVATEAQRIDAWDAPVPSCPGWALRDLVAHVGEVERWVLQAIEEGHGLATTPDVPGDAGLPDWLAESAEALLDALAADADAPAWTMAPPATIGFWIRRQAHEHAMHRWDATVALGRGHELDADLAADAVDEVVGTMLPRQLRLGRVAVPARGLVLDAGGRSLSIGDDPIATVSGSPADLALALWHRIEGDDHRLQWRGDAAAGRSILALPLAP